jgi:RNA polymerase sigma-70 factor (ECF subfamily)
MDLKEIIKANKENVKNIIRMISGNDNEDLEQEVYLRVWKNSDKYEEKGSIKGWISTITKNITKDYLKSAVVKREKLLEEDDNTFDVVSDKKETPELRLITNDRQKRITKAINGLKPKFKDVILYCEVYGYTYEDCAKKLKCPVGTIKSRLYNAKKQLADELEDLL